MEGAADFQEQRLIVIDSGNARAAGQAEKGERATARALTGGGRLGWEGFQYSGYHPARALATKASLPSFDTPQKGKSRAESQWSH